MSSYPTPLPTPLTPSQVQTSIQQITINVLGGTPESVRIGWQQQGQPSEGITSDVMFIRAAQVDDDRVDSQKDLTTLSSTSTEVTQVFQYMRVWRLFWCAYGPNSFDNMRAVKSALFQQQYHDQFSAANLYLVTDAGAPRRVPEQKGTGQWWERVDFEADFNELVYETIVSQTAASVEIKIYDSEGQIDDFVVELQEGGYGIGEYGDGEYGS